MTMLTEFFTLNVRDARANSYLYREIPEFYRWEASQKCWVRRRNKYRVIGRIYTVLPQEGDKFYLRFLLNHVRGPKSFEDLLTVDGTPYPTFKLSAEKRGLLDSDSSIRQCLTEASHCHMPSTLRRMFTTILIYCDPTGVRELWNEFWRFMAEDYRLALEIHAMNRLLKDLNELLLQHNKSISQYDLPPVTSQVDDDASGVPRMIQEELSVQIPTEDLHAATLLNPYQLLAFSTIMGAVERKQSAAFFVDGPGGTGKTFLYRALLATLRSRGHIALATATSGIAATLLPGGRTAHSRFKIPLNPDPSSVCSISKQSQLAELIRKTTLIIWDEATMTNRYAFEALDRTLKDITGHHVPFGGKIIVFGGDFRQVLPVVPKGTRAETTNACIARSPLWRNIQVLRLKQNMRTINDQEYSKFILRVGDGDEQTFGDDMINLPQSIVIPWNGESSTDVLIQSIFPDIAMNVNNSAYMVNRAIITPRNEDVDKLNDKVVRCFPGEERVYYSFDSVENDTQNLYQQEYLNSISPGGLPPHELKLKVGSPIMLLRNLDPSSGLCNGTRLICRGLHANFIDAEILSGHFKGERAFFHRIPLKPPENLNLGFEMTRRQFPIRLSFALTINKSQGQTIPHVGIYLPDHVFSHGQLYVALSRGTSQRTTKLLVKKGAMQGKDGVYTKM